MAKLIVCLAFVICCGQNMIQLQNMQAMAAGIAPISVADIITDYKAEKLWDDDLLMATTQVEESTLTNCGTMENGGLFILEEKPLLLMANTWISTKRVTVGQKLMNDDLYSSHSRRNIEVAINLISNMSKLIVYLVFIIYCANQAQNAGGRAGGQAGPAGAAGAAGVAAEVVTNYRADKLWDDDLLMETTQVEESTLTNYDTMKDGRLFILDEKPLLLMINAVNLIKRNLHFSKYQSCDKTTKMAKLIVYLAFIIYCGRAANQQQNAQGMRIGIVADVITDYKAEKLWDDELLMVTTQVEKSIAATLTNHNSSMKDGRLFILEEKPLLLMTNTVNLIN
ncbi:unnamed protein product [Brugia pahangi]|uniref:Metalloprotease n=1 Tax=Brugia pahangi TaxID=6280 RepID=A0A0N4T4F5_BRUPA|nr:unnamed protein product [Brugia pahangi]